MLFTVNHRDFESHSALKQNYFDAIFFQQLWATGCIQSNFVLLVRLESLLWLKSAFIIPIYCIPACVLTNKRYFHSLDKDSRVCQDDEG